MEDKRSNIEHMIRLLCSTRNKGATWADYLKRPEASVQGLPESITGRFDQSVSEQVEINIKYEGYLSQQTLEIGRLKKCEELTIPTSLSFDSIPGLSTEVRQKLGRVRPGSLAEASRISGITPAAISILRIYIKSCPERSTTAG